VSLPPTALLAKRGGQFCSFPQPIDDEQACIMVRKPDARQGMLCQGPASRPTSVRRAMTLAIALLACAKVACPKVPPREAWIGSTRLHRDGLSQKLCRTATHRHWASQRKLPTAQAALPETAVLLATTDPTPAVVSIAFNVITFLPQYLWLLMVLAPNWSVTRQVMQPLWPVLLFSLVHLFIVVTVASNNPDNVSDLTELFNVFDPRVYLNFFNDFSPQGSMMKLMKSPGFVSEEWSHVLAWDIFVGRWIYLDGQRRGIFTSHSVLFCNLIGPPGLLLHAATCLFMGKGLPSESTEKT